MQKGASNRAADANSERSGKCEKSVKGERCETCAKRETCGSANRVHCVLQSRFSYLSRLSRYFLEAAMIVKRIVPIRLISLTCSPTWISTLYRPGFHAPCGGESVR